MIKKLISYMLTAVLIIFLLSACGSSSNNNNNNTGAGTSDKISVVSTIFPQYDWVTQILGDHADTVDLTLLVNSGIDLHSFQPSVSDIAQISDCDMFIYVGGQSDEWVKDALNNAGNENMVVIDLLDIIGDLAKEEEIIEGMEDDHDHDNEADEHDHGADFDEHIWLSLKNVQILCDHIAKELAKLDPQNAEEYLSNNETYKERLAELDLKYENMVNEAKYDTVLFADRFPFRYLVDDYGLSYFAAFPGCSAETEASFETIVFLANKVDELDLNHVMVIEGSDQSIAKTIIENTSRHDRDILVLDSLQSITSSDITTGVNYLSIMEDNYDVLMKALN